MFPDPDCLKKLSLPARVVRHIRGRKMLYIWSAVVAGLAMGVWYCQLPLVVLPALLFLAFLASGGRKFPKVFFRTILRDVIGICRYIGVLWNTHQHRRNNRTIADVFQLTAAKYPNKVAITFEGKAWTFQEVEEYSNRVANYFKSQGYQKGEVIALLLENSPEFICMWLGLSKLGVITALINTNLRLDSLWHCISVANVRAVIFGTNFSGAIKEIQTRIPDIVQLYSLGSGPSTVGSAVNLDKRIEDSSPGKPMTSHPKSLAGRWRRQN